MNYEEQSKAKYNDSCLQKQVQPEWILMAEEVANAIISKYEPAIQNETLSHIRVLVRSKREMEIEETEKKLSYLKETIQVL